MRRSLGTATLTNVGGVAQASYTTSQLVSGTQTITAVYAGTAGYNASATNASQTVTIGSSSIALTASANPSPIGQTITLTATLSTTVVNGAAFTGTVALYEGSCPADGAGDPL